MQLPGWIDRAHSASAYCAAAVFVLTGCGGEPSTRSDIAEVWTVDSVPSLTLGLDDSENLDAAFERITGATRLPDGSVLVADLGAAPLKLFSADGEFVRRVAREGKGPGEITYLARFFRCGSKMYSYDIDGRRTSQWSLDGRYEREFRFIVPEGQQTPYVSACNAAGQFAHLGWGAMGARVAGYHRDTVPVWRSPTADGSPTIFDSVPASERWGQTHEGRIVGSRPLPLSKQPLVAVGAEHIYVATGDADGVRAYGLDGAALPRISVVDVAPPLTREDIQDLIDRDVLSRGESRRAAIEREYDEITFPPTKAAVTALAVDAEGLLWLRPARVPGATNALWQVHSPDGRARATVALPAALEVFEIGADYIIGREIDKLAGVPVLRQYRLRRESTR